MSIQMNIQQPQQMATQAGATPVSRLQYISGSVDVILPSDHAKGQRLIFCRA